MNGYPARSDDARRSGARRTAWVVGGVAIAIYLLFFLKQLVWH